MSEMRKDLIHTLMSDMTEPERARANGLLDTHGDERPVRGEELGDGCRWTTGALRQRSADWADVSAVVATPPMS